MGLYVILYHSAVEFSIQIGQKVLNDFSVTVALMAILAAMQITGLYSRTYSKLLLF